MAFIDKNIRSTVTRVGLIYFGLESTGTGLGFLFIIGNKFGFFINGLIDSGCASIITRCGRIYYCLVFIDTNIR